MNNILRSALWMSGAILSFSSMAIAGRAVATELDTFEIMMYRSFVGVVIVVVISTLTRTQSQITRRSLGVHFVRNAAHFAGQNLWFFALTLIPLAQVFALEFTSPLWVLVLSPFVLKERLTSTRAIAAILGFIGILIVARPGASPINAGVIAAALSAIGFAISIMLTKRLTRTESITCILFYLTTMQAIFGIICAGWDMDITLPSAQTAPWLILIGCAGLLAHFCLTTALSIAPATVVVPIDFIRLPAIAVIGMLFYNEPLDMFVLLGAAVIFAGNYLNILSETRLFNA
ncbi:Threonine/homoserine efflux transporter RhtA [Shimia gijangensis]|uniref:Threonine/homoserine efflux transporter RhtA n=1 Tax=Shimia gijangensis TaxID=1470563 RepID=A0A1M6HRT4_9RHOB|nr:DMT family transporter [Shimia gijangensis]SHJ24897.1 Threonine/homoserine efflux transporter RhtA [Shimia gijangensis]